MQFLSLYGKQLPCSCGAGKGDGNIQRYGDAAVGVAGKGKGRIGGGEEDAAVDVVKAIHHIGANSVVEAAVAEAYLLYFKAQPPAEGIAGEHYIQYLLRGDRAFVLHHV